MWFYKIKTALKVSAVLICQVELEEVEYIYPK